MRKVLIILAGMIVVAVIAVIAFTMIYIPADEPVPVSTTSPIALPSVPPIGATAATGAPSIP